MSAQVQGEATRPEESTQAARKPGRRASIVVLLFTMLAVGVRVTRLGTDGSPSVSEMLMIVAALFVLCHALLYPKRSIIRIDSSLKFFGAFLLWASASYFWALHPEVVASEVIAVGLKGVTYALVIACTLTRRHVDHWGHLFVLMSLGFALSAINEGAAGGKESFLLAAQEAGGWTWINHFGKWTCFLLPFNIHYIAFGNTRLMKFLAGLGIVGNLVTVYLISRRAPLLVITLELIIFAVLFRQYRKTFIGFALLLMLALPVLVVGNKDFAARVAMTAVEISARLQGEDIAFGSVRFMQYQAGAAAVRAHYLVGLGIGSLRFWTHEVYGFRMVFWPHNLTLQILGELGIPGGLLYAGFVLTALGRGWRTWKHLMRENQFREASLVTAMICGVIGLVVYGQFQPILTEMHLYLALSVLSVTALIYRTPAPEPASEEADATVD